MTNKSKIPVSVWDKAKALYQADKSLREIEKETGIDYSMVGKKAKSEAWERGILPQLINDSIRVKTQFATLNLPQQEVVTQLVDEKTKAIQFYNTKQRRFAQIASEIVERKYSEDELSLMELAQASRTTKDSRESELGRVPETAIQINNNSGIVASVSTMSRADRERRLAELMGIVG